MSQGIHVKAPIGIALNTINSGFHHQFGGLAGFLDQKQEVQTGYLKKIMAMQDAAKAKDQESSVVAAYLFALYISSAIDKDEDGHARVIRLMTDLSRAGDMLSD